LEESNSVIPISLKEEKSRYKLTDLGISVI